MSAFMNRSVILLAVTLLCIRTGEGKMPTVPTPSPVAEPSMSMSMSLNYYFDEALDNLEFGRSSDEDSASNEDKARDRISNDEDQ